MCTLRNTAFGLRASGICGGRVRCGGMPVRAFRVKLPSAERYWTAVVDDEYRVVGDVDEYLRHVRFGQDVAESTTKAYAESLAL
jgi:hypothetical protein